MSEQSKNGTESIASSAPRLCHVIKRENFDGYGFNLHAEKGKPGQYIGKVDDGSPAERAGLKQGDRIIEVNGADIGTETHKQVVQRIKALADEVRLLVVDPPDTQSTHKNGATTTTTPIQTTTTTTTTTVQPPTIEPDVKVTEVNGNGVQTDNIDPPNKIKPTEATGGLNLKMTAAELRAKLAAKKKYDPKSDTVDLRKKYDIIQKL